MFRCLALASVTGLLLIAGLHAQTQAWVQKDILSPRSACPGAYDSVRGRVVIFGAGLVPSAETWEWDGSGWNRAHPVSSPSPRRSYAIAFDAARGRTVLFGGCTASRQPLTDTWEWDGVSWSLRTTTTSPAATGAMVYDSVRGRTVHFTGSETWEWDGMAWTKLSPPLSPPARQGCALAFDTMRGRAVLFGGTTASLATHFADTWEWDGVSWVDRTPPSGPSGRFDHAMAYDAARQRVVLHGGTVRSPAGNVPVAETWDWDGSTWTQQASPMSPSARDNHVLVAETGHNRLLLFGGFGARYVLLGDTWARTGTTWSQLAPSAAPMGGDGPGMAFDVRGRLIVFGGGGINNPNQETWEWDGYRWQRVLPAVSPPPRAWHAMTYDDARQRVLVFGGWSFAGGSGLADTWEWDGTTWARRFPASSPPPRHGGAMAFDTVRARAVLFGGYGTTAQFVADTWEWDGTSWTQRTPAGGPGPRAGSAMAYDPRRGRVVLFGGDLGSSHAGDTWEWDGTSWRQATPATAPSARAWPAMAFDPQRGRVVLFGGLANNGAANDLWEWDGVNWTQLSLAGAPLPRYAHALVADGLQQRLVLFGGVHRGPYDYTLDTWLLGTGTAAAAVGFGQGCGGASIPRLDAFGRPWRGAPRFGFDVSSARANAPCAIGLAAAPANLSIGACTLYVQSPVVTLSLTANSKGFGSLTVPVPPDPALVGSVYAQAFVLDASAPIGIAFTGGHQATIGD